MNMNNIIFDSDSMFVKKERFLFLEKIIGILFPLLYIDLIKNNDGGTPIQCCFQYYDEYSCKKLEGAIGCFSHLNDSDHLTLLDNYNDPPEFFPKGLIAFAENGGGDFICFDYRQGKDNPDPPIVYWRHGADEGKDVSFIAKNFEEFINMLYEPED
jgi:hypothetical protein